MKKYLINLLTLMSFTAHAQTAVIPQNRLAIGKTGASDKIIEFNITKAGATANPKIKYNNTTQKIQKSDDGVNFLDIGSGGSADNKLTNGNFETSTTAWTASGGTFTTTTTAANVFEGLAAGSWDSNSAAQTFTGTAITVGGLAGTNAELTCMIQVPSGTATHTLGVWDGSTLSSAVTINSSSTYAATTINFVVPSSGTITPRITSVNADEPLVYVDDCYVGKARNIVNAAPQARLMGTAVMTGCSGSFSRGQTTSTFGAMTGGSVPTGCSWAVTGSATAPSGTARPAFTFSSLPVGDYRIEYEGAVTTRAITASVNDGFFQFTDGTITARETSMATTPGSAANSGHSTISQSFSYTSPQSNKTWEIYAKGTGVTGDDEYISGTTAKPGVLRLWYYPPVGQQAVSSAQADYDWTSFTITSSNTQGIGTPTLSECQHSRVSSDLKIRCKGTTGTTTASEMRINYPNGLIAADTTKIPSIQKCGDMATSAAAGNSRNVLCEPSVGYMTFSINSNNPLTKATGSALFTTGDSFSFTATIPIQGWSSNQRAPTLVGSVTSNANNAERIERAQIANNGTLSITSQSGSWITLNSTSPSNGGGTINFSSSFSVAPSCVCTVGPGTSGSNAELCYISAVSTTSMTWRVYTGAAAAQNDPVSIICMGAR